MESKSFENHATTSRRRRHQNRSLVTSDTGSINQPAIGRDNVFIRVFLLAE